ncbi:hypothetical protein XH87_12360 [Bradyrhizobium sp. CCBAU 53415]|nr:hypothetical protein [Bradyrhizobium sp. CCBAU 53415]
MMHLITSPEAWAAQPTLTSLEIALGIDNAIFLSVGVSRIPEQQAYLCVLGGGRILPHAGPSATAGRPASARFRHSRQRRVDKAGAMPFACR